MCLNVGPRVRSGLHEVAIVVLLLEEDVVLAKVEHLSQPQSLMRPVELQPDAVCLQI